MKVKEHQSKADNYDIGQRLEDLKNVVEIQCSPGNVDQGEYMRGMANGLLLAWHIIREPLLAEIPYFEAPTEGKEIKIGDAGLRELTEMEIGHDAVGGNTERPRGNGFWADDQFYLQRCFDCGRENWAPAVASGSCAWCGSTKHPEVKP